MQIEIDSVALRRIRGFTHLASGEVVGMGRTKMNKANNSIFVYDVKLLPKQVVSFCSASLDVSLVAEFLSSVENPNEFKFLWHSHGNMEAFMSTTDTTCVKSLLKTSNYIISCVSSKKTEWVTQLDINFNGVVVSISCNLVEKYSNNYEDLKEEFDKNVQQEHPYLFNLHNSFYSGKEYSLFTKKRFFDFDTED